MKFDGSVEFVTNTENNKVYKIFIEMYLPNIWDRLYILFTGRLNRLLKIEYELEKK